MEINLYNQRAESVGKVSLPDAIFAVPMNKDLLYQVVTSQIANKRQTVAHTKDRSEVSGGGKKPWRQKGTGRARHGSIRSPIWKGGGTTFGPRKERNFKKKINRKMAQKALFVALSSKVHDKEMIVVDDINFENWKTKEMAKVMAGLRQILSRGSYLVVTPKEGIKTIGRVSKNLPNVDVMEAKDLNALSVVGRKNIILLKNALEVIEKTFKA